MKKAVFRKLISIAKAIVQQVQQTITQQVNVVQDEVQKRIQQYIEEVVSDMWKGRGADSFVKAVNDDVMPKLAQVVQNVTQTHKNISTAVQIMDEADAKVNSLVGNLRDTFDRI